MRDDGFRWGLMPDWMWILVGFLVLFVGGAVFQILV